MVLSAHHVEVISITERKSLQEILQNVAGRIAPRYFRCTNCFKLDRNIFKDIVEDALPKILSKIQGLATLLKEEYRDKDFEDEPSFAHLSYPGSEIPEWFNVQSWGSLVKVTLPPDWSNNFVGFILCTVAAEPMVVVYDTTLSIACRYTSSYGHVVNEFFIDTLNIEYLYNSKHMIIWFDSRLFHHNISESLSCSTEVSFRFHLRSGSNKLVKRNMVVLELEKCGVRLMYNQRHHDRSDGSFCTGEERDETNQGKLPCRYHFACYLFPSRILLINVQNVTWSRSISKRTVLVTREVSALIKMALVKSKMHSDRWKITFEKGCNVKYVNTYRRTFTNKKSKEVSKAPKIQRLVTPLTLQRKRTRIVEKKKRIAKAKADAAEYQKLLATRLKEQRDRRSESLAKKRSRMSATSKPSVVA
ncbi:hypothetical protein EZV62_024919 [Acer yangbiense]|uniref:C-JID domain-containing protein n=1 Tax=Acer yangbiense TaxID=1000413 RepID=A0A5C7GW75_9ROSI|nr:hypothetical protein EZV62_024919 [Acer yangbiense]